MVYSQFISSVIEDKCTVSDIGKQLRSRIQHSRVHWTEYRFRDPDMSEVATLASRTRQSQHYAVRGDLSRSDPPSVLMDGKGTFHSPAGEISLSGFVGPRR